MTKVYKQYYKSYGFTLQISADFVEAASPIFYRTDDDEKWQGTPFIVANFRHDPKAAIRGVHEWAKNQAA